MTSHTYNYSLRKIFNLKLSFSCFLLAPIYSYGCFILGSLVCCLGPPSLFIFQRPYEYITAWLQYHVVYIARNEDLIRIVDFLLILVIEVERREIYNFIRSDASCKLWNDRISLKTPLYNIPNHLKWKSGTIVIDLKK